MEDCYQSPQADLAKLGLDPDPWPTVQAELPAAAASPNGYHKDYMEEVLTEPTEKRKAIGPIPAIWGYLLWGALRRLQIRTTGVGKLVAYFQESISYERFLYGTGDEWYRAHFPTHIFSVLIHGLKLLNSAPFCRCINLFNRDLSDFYGEEQHHTQHTQHTFTSPDSHRLFGRRRKRGHRIFASDESQAIKAIWTIAALCHDLGVPLQKTIKLNEAVRTMFKQYGGMDLTDLRYQATDPQSALFDSLLEAVSHTASVVSNGIGPDPVLAFRTQQVLLAKRKIALIEMDHGIASALLVWKTLDGISDVLAAPHGQHILDAKTCRRFILVREALAAIADHSNEHLYSRHCNLAFLLRICDEASERYRPKAINVFRAAGVPPPPLSQLEITGEKITFIPGPPRTVEFEYIVNCPNRPTMLAFIEDQLRKNRKLAKTLGHLDLYASDDFNSEPWKIKETFPTPLTFTLHGQVPPLGSQSSLPPLYPGGPTVNWSWEWPDLSFRLEVP